MMRACKYKRIKGLWFFHNTLLERIAIISALTLLVMGSDAHGQGIVRDSLAGQNAAEASLNQNADNQPSNFQLGPVTLRVEAGATVRYNDNITLANSGKLADGIIEPTVGLHALWQATEANALTLDLDLSYQHYLEHSGYDAFLISPNSQTLFNVYIGDFKIAFKDAFSYQDDPVQVGQLSNLPQFRRFTNDAGIKVDWDLSDVILSLGYDHTNFWVFESTYEYLDYQSDMLSPQVTFNVSPTIQAGLSTSFDDVRYDQNIQNNYTQIRAGPFVTATLTDNLSVNAQAGWNYANFDTGGLNGDTEDINSFYCGVGVNHRINDVLTESLIAGREFLPGITSNFTQRIYANYTPVWQITTSINLSAPLWWENLADSQGNFREISNRYGAGLNLTFAVTDHVTFTAGYQYIRKSSDITGLSYEQNAADLSLRYSF
jgi:hypothetical protein